MLRSLMGATYVALCLASSVGLALGAEPSSGYEAEVFVKHRGSIDSVFPLANQSPAEPPGGWNLNYKPEEQRFALFVPPEATAAIRPKGSDKKASTGFPLILFISPGKNPQGWPQLEKVCRQNNVFFASPYDAGNNCDLPRRVQIILDILSQLRADYPIDPEQTYLAGFSGGGRVALMLAYALPEYFGGVIPVCAAETPREESWLRERVASRLSIALVTGENDFNRGEVERWKGPMLAEVGIRSRVWVVPKLGHGVPGGETFAEIYDWLKEGLPERQKVSQQWSATVAKPKENLKREEQASALLDEAKQRLAQPTTLYSGLMQLKGISTRWPDLPEAKAATKLLLEHDARDERPWEEADIAEQRKYLIAEARGLTDYATGPLPAQYAPLQPRMAAAALQMWKQILADGQDKQAVQEAQQRMPELEKLLPEKK